MKSGTSTRTIAAAKRLEVDIHAAGWHPSAPSPDARAALARPTFLNPEATQPLDIFGLHVGWCFLTYIKRFPRPELTPCDQEMLWLLSIVYVAQWGGVVLEGPFDIEAVYFLDAQLLEWSRERLEPSCEQLGIAFREGRIDDDMPFDQLAKYQPALDAWRHEQTLGLIDAPSDLKLAKRAYKKACCEKGEGYGVANKDGVAVMFEQPEFLADAFRLLGEHSKVGLIRGGKITLNKLKLHNSARALFKGTPKINRRQRKMASLSGIVGGTGDDNEDGLVDVHAVSTFSSPSDAAIEGEERQRFAQLPPHLQHVLLTYLRGRQIVDAERAILLIKKAAEEARPAFQGAYLRQAVEGHITREVICAAVGCTPKALRLAETRVLAKFPPNSRGCEPNR